MSSLRLIFKVIYYYLYKYWGKRIRIEETKFCTGISKNIKIKGVISGKNKRGSK